MLCHSTNSGAEFACEFCGVRFARRSPRGRRPLYCGRSCRQRAYEERRRAAFVMGLPLPTLLERQTPRRPAYESGVGGRYGRTHHALRADGVADRLGWRPTLCGIRVVPSRRPFSAWPSRTTAAWHQPPDPPQRSPDPPKPERGVCRRCLAIATRYPPARRIDPVTDLGTITALIGMLRGARRAPEPVLRNVVEQLLAHFGAPAGSHGDAEQRPRVAAEDQFLLLTG